MNFWNKTASALLALLLVLPLTLAGCGKKTVNDGKDTAPDTSVQQNGKESVPRYNFDLSEYVKLGQYKGIEVEAYDVTVSEEELQQQVLIARATYATVAEKEGTVAMGDQVVIDFVGYMDGEKFEGGSAENYNVMIGSGSMIEGFEDGLIGAQKGETVTLDIAFPTPYPNNPALAGLPVQFDVTIQSIFEQVLPVYDDAFVSEKYQCATVAEFEEKLRTAMQEKNEEVARTYTLQTIWKTLAENCEILSYPTEEYTVLYQDNLNYYEGLATQESVSLNEYVLNSYGMDVSTFYETLRNNIYARMQEEMIWLAIARAEEITVSEAEYEAGLASYVAYYGLSSADELLAYISREQITESLLFEKVDDFLLESAVVKEA